METNNTLNNYIGNIFSLIGNDAQAQGTQGQEGVDATAYQQRLEKLKQLLGASLILSTTEGDKADSSAPAADEIFSDVKDVKIISDDLERVIAKLEAEVDEKVLARLKKDIENKKSSLANNFKKSMEKIEKSVADAKKSEEAARRKRRWGIFGAILSIFAAVIVTVCTGGAAAGFAIAGAALSVGSLIMEETGLMKKITDSIANRLQKNHPEWSKAKCQAVAGGIMGGIFLALNLVCMIGGFGAAGSQMKNLGDSVKELMQLARGIQTVLNGVNTGVSLGMSVEGIVLNKKAGDSAAEATEMQAVLLEIKKQLEELNEDLEKLLGQLSQVFTKMADLINENVVNSNDILKMTSNLV